MIDPRSVIKIATLALASQHLLRANARGLLDTSVSPLPGLPGASPSVPQLSGPSSTPLAYGPMTASPLSSPVATAMAPAPTNASTTPPTMAPAPAPANGTATPPAVAPAPTNGTATPPAVTPAPANGTGTPPAPLNPGTPPPPPPAPGTLPLPVGNTTVIVSNPVIINNVINQTLQVTLNEFIVATNQIITQQNNMAIGHVQTSLGSSLDTCASNIITTLNAQLVASLSLTAAQQTDLQRIVAGTVHSQVGSVQQGLPSTLQTVNQGVSQQTETLVEYLRARLAISLTQNLTVLANTQGFCPVTPLPPPPSACIAPPVVLGKDNSSVVRVACSDFAGAVTAVQCQGNTTQVDCFETQLSEQDALNADSFDATLTRALAVDLRNITAVTHASSTLACVQRMFDLIQSTSATLSSFGTQARDALVGRPTLGVVQLEDLLNPVEEAEFLQAFLPGAQNLTLALAEAPELMHVLRDDIKTNATSLQDLF